MDRTVHLLWQSFEHGVSVGFGVQVFYVRRCILGSWLYNADNMNRSRSSYMDFRISLLFSLSNVLRFRQI